MLPKVKSDTNISQNAQLAAAAARSIEMRSSSSCWVQPRSDHVGSLQMKCSKRTKTPHRGDFRPPVWRSQLAKWWPLRGKTNSGAIQPTSAPGGKILSSSSLDKIPFGDRKDYIFIKVSHAKKKLFTKFDEFTYHCSPLCGERNESISGHELKVYEVYFFFCLI